MWWNGDAGEPGWFLWGMESLWLPMALLQEDVQARLADGLFFASRHSRIELHFNKGLAGAADEAIAATRETAMNPAVCDAFALAILGAGQSPAYPGIVGHEPQVAAGRIAAKKIDAAMGVLRSLVPRGGAYVSESSYFQRGFEEAYWGANAARLAQIKKKYDPDGLFFAHNGVGSLEWSKDGFTRL